LAQLWLLGRGGGALVPSYLRNTYSDSIGDFCIIIVSFTHFEKSLLTCPKRAGCWARHQPSGLGPLQLIWVYYLGFTCFDRHETAYLRSSGTYSLLDTKRASPRATDVIEMHTCSSSPWSDFYFNAKSLTVRLLRLMTRSKAIVCTLQIHPLA